MSVKPVFAAAFVLTLFAFFACSLSSPQVEQFFIDDYPVVRGTGPTLYVDRSAGSDDNDGLSPETAWQTVAKVNASTLPAGTTVRFKRGEVWRERLTPQSGTATAWISYSDYGTGELPLFLGSVEANEATDWVNLGGNLWRYNGNIPDDAGNLFFDNSVSGQKVWSLADVNAGGEFYYDKNTSQVTLYATANPAALYTDIEIWTGQHMLYTPVPAGSYQYMGVTGQSNIIIENLAVRYGGAYAFKFQGVHHIIVQNCDIGFCGGAELEGREEVRYGNGIEFYGYAFYCRAVSNTIYEMYDSGVSVQCVAESPVACGVEFSGNVIYNCALASYELWYVWEPRNTQAILSNVSFTGNICSNAGGGWGAQRPDTGGYHILMDAALARTSGIVITNNSFVDSKRWFFALNTSFDNYENALIDHNRYESPTNAKTFIAFTWSDHEVVHEFDFTQLADYRAATGYGAHSEFIIR